MKTKQKDILEEELDEMIKIADNISLSFIYSKYRDLLQSIGIKNTTDLSNIKLQIQNFLK